MKYFLDSAKLDEIEEAYHSFGIDGVTTNPRHIMDSGKPFLTAVTDIAFLLRSILIWKIQTKWWRQQERFLRSLKTL